MLFVTLRQGQKQAFLAEARAIVKLFWLESEISFFGRSWSQAFARTNLFWLELEPSFFCGGILNQS